MIEEFTHTNAAKREMVKAVTGLLEAGNDNA